MSIYLRIKDKTFKVPNRIVIGRGAPFHLFNDDQEICRAHVLLVKKGEKFYLKLLSEDADFFVNNDLLELDKTVKVTSTDKLVIGKYQFEILAERPEEYTEIDRGSIVDREGILQLYLPYILAIGLHLPVLFPNPTVPRLLACLLTAAFVVAIMKLVTKRLPMKFVKELFLSDEGFTAHYVTGQNMSFRWEQIDAWTLTSNRKVLTVYAFEDVYVMNLVGNFTALITFLEDRLKDKRELVSPINPLRLGAYLGVLGLAIYLSGQLSLVLILALVGWPIATLLSENLRKYWIVVVHRNLIRKHQTISLFVAIALGAIVLMDMKSRVDNYRLVEACHSKDQVTCPKLNFYVLAKTEETAIYVPARFRLTKDLLSVSCESANSSACQLLKKIVRSPASSPKE